MLDPISLALALLAGELGISAVAFLVAYAVTVDRGPAYRRALALLPTAFVTGAWFLVHSLGGFSSEASGSYVDPLRDPLGFATLALDRSRISDRRLRLHAPP